jgi:hypothetical protein
LVTDTKHFNDEVRRNRGRERPPIDARVDRPP